jgi:drug/metabolite transporter (DMT)-like permease
MSRRQLVALLALSAIWGASFMFIKVAVRDFEPGTLIFLRVGLAAATLLPIVLVRTGTTEIRRHVRGKLGALVVAGAVNSAIPFWLISWAEQSIDSGLTAILQACAPLFTALLAWRFSRGQRVTGARLVGLVIGFVGVALLVGLPGGAADPLAALAVVLSGLCYAAAALYVGDRLAGVPPLVASAGALGTATLLTAPLGIAQLPASVPAWKPTVSALVLGVAGTAVAYLLYYSLIAGAGASRAILVTYLVPSLALLYGAVFLDEQVTLVAVAGLALVLAGVALGTGAVRLADRSRLASERS